MERAFIAGEIGARYVLFCLRHKKDLIAVSWLQFYVRKWHKLINGLYMYIIYLYVCLEHDQVWVAFLFWRKLSQVS